MELAGLEPATSWVRSRAHHRQPAPGAAFSAVGCVNSIALQIARFRVATEFAHPTALVPKRPWVAACLENR
jgi:hypothetical protein